MFKIKRLSKDVKQAKMSLLCQAGICKGKSTPPLPHPLTAYMIRKNHTTGSYLLGLHF